MPRIESTDAGVQRDFAIRPALATKRIARRDANNKELAPNTLHKLPDGTTITSKQYFDGVNKLEAKLNASGYSLLSGPATEKVGSFIVSDAKTAALRAALEKSVAPGPTAAVASPITTEKLRVQGNNYFVGQQYSGGIHPTVGPLGVESDWYFQTGGTVENGAKHSRSDSKTRYSFRAGFETLGTAFGMAKEFGSADVDAESGTDQDSRFKLSITVVGNQIVNIDSKLPSVKDSIAYPFDSNADTALNILPGVVVEGKIGMIGSIGVRYDCELSGGYVIADLNPFVQAKLYGEAGIGLGFADNSLVLGVTAGLKVDVTLVDESFDAKATIGFTDTAPNKLGAGFLDKLTITNHLNVLGGDINGFVNVDVGPFTKTFDAPLYSWCGIQWDRTIFDVSHFAPYTFK